MDSARLFATLQIVFTALTFSTAHSATYDVSIQNDSSETIVLPRQTDPPVPPSSEDVIVNVQGDNEDGLLSLNCQQFKSVVRVNVSLKNEDGKMHIYLPNTDKPAVVTLTSAHDNEDGEVHVHAGAPASLQTVHLNNNDGDEGVFKKHQATEERGLSSILHRRDTLLKIHEEVTRAKRADKFGDHHIADEKNDEAWREHVITAEAGEGKKWYKIQIYTLSERFGGTDGDVSFGMVTSRANIPPSYSGARGYLLDSPGDSHEQGDYDIYYTRNAEIGEIRSEDVVEVYSRARNGVDHWSFQIKLYELNEGQWTHLKTFADDHDYSVSGGPWNAPRHPSGSVHIGRNGARLYRRRDANHVSKTYPPGVDIFEISP